MSHSTNFSDLFDKDINLKGLFDIISPENNLVLADDMMLSDADGIILRVSETYEKNFGFAHDSIVGKSAFDLEANGTFSPCVTAEVIRQRKKITATQTINQTHKNVMAIASLKELAAIVLVKGNKPEDDTLEAAIEEGIPILGTDKQTFETSGIIYEMLKK